MAWINNNAIVLECGRILSFDNIFPIKILYPLVLMSDSTVYNIYNHSFILTKNDTKVKNVNDILYSCMDEFQEQIFNILKIKNSMYCVNYIGHITSLESTKNIHFIIYDDIIVYTEKNVVIVGGKAVSTYTAIDIDCQHIQTNMLHNSLEIYLLKNNNVILYHFDIFTNEYHIKKTYNININIFKLIKDYFIGNDGSFYYIDVAVNYKRTAITKIHTTYRICDIMVADIHLKHILLLTFNHEILKYNCHNCEMKLIGSDGLFCLSYNNTKSAKLSN